MLLFSLWLSVEIPSQAKLGETVEQSKARYLSKPTDEQARAGYSSNMNDAYLKKANLLIFIKDSLQITLKFKDGIVVYEKFRRVNGPSFAELTMDDAKALMAEESPLNTWHQSGDGREVYFIRDGDHVTAYISTIPDGSDRHDLQITNVPADEAAKERVRGKAQK